MLVLLGKELKLALSPLTKWFLCFALVTLIPRYPILTGAVLVCVGILYSFQSFRESGDILYSLLLPLRRRDVVAGKFALCVLVEWIAFACMAGLAALRMTVLHTLPVYESNVMMAANLWFLALTLLIFMAFNFVFVGGFFRSGGHVGRPFLRFLPLALILVLAGETLYRIPALSLLNRVSGRGLWVQAALLGGAFAAYFGLTLLALRQSQARFEEYEV